MQDLKIFRLENGRPQDLDYHYCIVVATDFEDALLFHPSGKCYWDYEKNEWVQRTKAGQYIAPDKKQLQGWPKPTEHNIFISQVGTALRGMERGVICFQIYLK